MDVSMTESGQNPGIYPVEITIQPVGENTNLIQPPPDPRGNGNGINPPIEPEQPTGCWKKLCKSCVFL